MNLYVVLGAVLERLRRADARGRCGFRQLRRVGRERPGAVIAIRTRQRCRDIHVGEDVLHRLERADRPSEGDTVERIVATHFKRTIGAADLFEREQHRGAVEHLSEDAPAITGRPQRLGLGVLEGEFGLAPCRIDIGQRLGFDAAGLQVDQEQ